MAYPPRLSAPRRNALRFQRFRRRTALERGAETRYNPLLTERVRCRVRLDADAGIRRLFFARPLAESQMRPNQR